MLSKPGTPQNTHGAVLLAPDAWKKAGIQLMGNSCSKITPLSHRVQGLDLQIAVTGVCVSMWGSLYNFGFLFGPVSIKRGVKDWKQIKCINSSSSVCSFFRKIKESLECFPVKLNNLMHTLAQMSVGSSAKPPAPEPVPQEWMVLDTERSLARATILGFTKNPDPVCILFFCLPSFAWIFNDFFKNLHTLPLPF